MKAKFNLKKTMYFDRALVKKLAGAAGVVLSRWGAYVRRRSRSSLKPARQKSVAEMTADEKQRYDVRLQIAKQEGKKKPRRPEINSKPGQPPKLHRTDRWSAAKSPLKTKIEFVFDPRTKSTIVGPEASEETRGDATEALEHGGTSMVGPRRRRVRARISARPFMQPAADAERPNLLKWRNTVK